MTTQRFQLVAGYSRAEPSTGLRRRHRRSLPAALLGGALLHRIGLLYLIAEELGAGSPPCC